MTHILLIRHAQSANNALPEHKRIPDPGLTDLGVIQAKLTAAALSSQSIAQLYCSPFLRSLETARPLAAALGLPVSIRSDIFEQGGCYRGHIPGELVGEPGMTSTELAARYPGWPLDPRIGAEGWWGQPYETLEQATARAQRVAAWLVSDLTRTAGVHALVIHADFKRLLLEALFGPALLTRLGPLHNVGVTRCHWDRDHWQLLSLNATTHLPADHVT